jgi:hypothetical protein
VGILSRPDNFQYSIQPFKEFSRSKSIVLKTVYNKTFILRSNNTETSFMERIENYPIHNDYARIFGLIEKLNQTDDSTAKKLKDFVLKIKEVENRLVPFLRKQTSTQDEQGLWNSYQSLQEEKLAILDLKHEWDYMEMSNPLSDEIKILTRDAIEELEDHVSVIAETKKAYIDVLEIKNGRQFGIFALVVSFVISYAAVWEFFVRDIIANVSFPYGLSPDLNFTLSILALTPILLIVLWARKRRITK